MRLPHFILAVLCLAFLTYIWGTASQLPEKVATHFDLHGTADGWMTKGEHLIFICAFGIGMPLFLAGVFSIVGVIPARFVNIPNRDYWLSPERKAETAAWLHDQGLWLASVMVCWMGGLNYAVLQANLQRPPHLSGTHLQWLTGALLGYIVFFIIQTFRRFRKS